MVYVANDVEPDEGDIFNGIRQCRVCRQKKSMEEFYFTSSGKHRARKCKKCVAARTREWREENREKWAPTARKRHLWQNYRMTEVGFNMVWVLQSGLCAICKDAFLEGDAKIHVDHDHATGQVRGLLCPTCNRGLGQFRDDPSLMRSAAEYVESFKPKAEKPFADQGEDI